MRLKITHNAAQMTQRRRTLNTPNPFPSVMPFNQCQTIVWHFASVGCHSVFVDAVVVVAFWNRLTKQCCNFV